ncbi:MAG: endolytic transglycosylase MltG [Lachnospiraceae bacterium]|nr:endolytic transglycosylase MltG [Lachnospiraceae bacterium]
MDTKEIIESVFSAALKIVLLVVAVMFIYKYAVMAYDYGYRVFTEEPVGSGEGRVVNVTITPEMDVKAIAEELEELGLIRDALLFRIQEKVSENSGNIVPGVYELNTNMTAEEMIAVMSNAEITTETEEQMVSTVDTESESDTDSYEETEGAAEEAEDVEAE